jgi:hypothetical protein
MLSVMFFTDRLNAVVPSVVISIVVAPKQLGDEGSTARSAMSNGREP